MKKRFKPKLLTGKQKVDKEKFAALVFGSGRGMCGQFNDHIATFSTRDMDNMNIDRDNRVVLAVGEKVVYSLQNLN